uniref:Uncharacterized protein n=1 Tax=Anguilla anguilla TaxID=7936 RepID=A0A0E9QGI6_ANGAN
MGLGYIGM